MHKRHPRHTAKSCYSLLAGAALLAATQAAQAESFAWDGPYVGIAMGAQHSEYDWKTTDYVDPSGYPMPSGIFGSNKENLDSNDYLTDVFAGYNWTVSPQVIAGLEAHARYAHARDTQTVPGVSFGSPTIAGPSSVEVKTNWSGDLRGRVGYLFQPDMLVYASAGVAYTRLDTTVTCPADTNVCNPAYGTIDHSDSENATGWLAGVGLEAALTDNLSARFEYLYSDYGTIQVDGLPAVPGESFGFNGDVDLTTQSLTAGLAYKF